MLMVIAATTLWAGQLRVRSFTPDYSDLSASTYKRNDLNGRPCALVIVELPVEGCRFQGNIRGEVEFMVSQYWVYLTEGTRMLKILCPGAEAFMAELVDENGNVGVESQVTYHLFLDGYGSSAPSTTANVPQAQAGTGSQNRKEVTYSDLLKIYDDARSFREGLAIVVLKGNYGFVNNLGEVVVPIKYHWASDFSEGLAVVKLNGKYGFVNQAGELAIPFKYDDAGSFTEGLAAIKINGKSGFINQAEETVVPVIYDGVRPFSDGLAAVKLNGSYGFINRAGEVAVPVKYDEVQPFSDGLAAVKLNGKYGFVNKAGKVVVPLKFDNVREFRDGKARAELKGKWGDVDKNGNFKQDK